MPQLTVHLDKIAENYKYLSLLMKKQKRSLVTVSKVVRSYPPLLRYLNNQEPGIFADTRWENLHHALMVTPEVYFLNPSPLQIRGQLRGISRFYMADYNLIKKLSDMNLKPVPRIVLSVESGGLREGVPPEQVLQTAERICQLSGVRLEGLGTTFGCLLGMFPQDSDIETLVSLKYTLEKRKIPCPIISTGGTILMDRILKGTLPPELNEIRLGEAVFFGYNTFTQKPIEVLNSNTFSLECSTLESFIKDTTREGEFGVNVFGQPGQKNHPLLNRGHRQRALIDIGSALVGSKENLIPLDNLELVALSYDQGVVDFGVPPAKAIPQRVTFHVNYDGVARLMLHPYLKTKMLSH